MLRRVRWFAIFATAFIGCSVVAAVIAGTTTALQLVAIYLAVLAVFMLVAELVVRSK